MNTFNGWKNYETWNVALWIANDEGLYAIAKDCKDYSGFVDRMHELDVDQTPDGVKWKDRVLDTDALDEVFEDL